MRFRLLGSLTVSDEAGGRIPLARPKHRQLLATLLLDANRDVSVDRLVDHLWDGTAPRSAVGMIRTYVWQLRRLLAPRDPATAPLRSRGATYRIDVAPADVDLLVFLDLVGRGRDALADGRAREADALLRRALDMWRGEALQDVPLSRNLGIPAGRLEDERLSAFEGWADARLALGRHQDVVQPLWHTIRREPLREGLWGRLMLALHRGGRRADALQAFRQLRRNLVAEIGVEPARELWELQQAILADAPDLRAPGPGSPARVDRR
ncbi:BTAD domain-containing putative transcriptional regulator [Actinosynnema sp. NPDC059335]|uniref:AfsR/SARP family transcriptional regulator n=1 Tax=Actinosynnema sp. NPDC059335 TaxID=3346804 RepID=UPI0036720D71